MAVAHNLSNIADNLSCYNPVAGETPGISIGKSWFLWKVFQGLLAFDTNIKLITNASPTPAFLQSYIGANLQTEPTKNRGTVNDSIRFYMTNDLGLSQATPFAMVYEWKITSISSNMNLCSVNCFLARSGDALYSPIADNIIITGSSTTESLAIIGWTGTASQSTHDNLPLILFWKSNNANVVMGINKTTGVNRGYLVWYNPTFTGYATAFNGVITNGENFRSTIFTNAATATNNAGASFIEGRIKFFGGNLSSLPNGLSPLCSVGTLPSVLFDVSSVASLIAGKLKFGVISLTQCKAISEEIDGIILANTSAASSGVSAITLYNGTYYMELNQINDGRDRHRILIQLGT